MDAGFNLILMPDTYFKTVDYVGLLRLVGKDCVDNIRNISQYVFPRWADLIRRTQDRDQLTAQAGTIIGNCDTVISSIEDVLRKFGKNA